MKRIFDISSSFFLFFLLCPFFLVIFLLIFFTSKGPVIYWSKRVGKYNKIFNMPKFRTMYLDAPELASHLLNTPQKFLTPAGLWLRKLSLDEIPQIWSIFIGNMSFVGPRPALFNQYDLIEERDLRGVYSVRPGITGLAQIKKIDMSTPHVLALTDAKMVNELSVFNYFKIIFLTISGKGFGDSI